MDVTASWRARREAPIPILLGWNSNEAARFIGPATRAEYLTNIKSFGKLAPDLLRIYPADNDAEASRAAVDLESDFGFGWRGWSLAEARLATTSPATFVYQFDNPPPGPDGTRTKGAVHSDELRYVWGNDDPEGKWPIADKALEETVQAYWVNFARTGDPNGPELTRWAPYQVGRTAVWFSNGAPRAGRVLREDQLRAVDHALRDPTH